MHLPNIHLLFGFSLGFEALPSQGSGKNSQFLFFRVNDTFWILVLYFRLDRLRTLWLRYRCWTVLFISRVNRQILIITMLLHYALHYFFFQVFWIGKIVEHYQNTFKTRLMFRIFLYATLVWIFLKIDWFFRKMISLRGRRLCMKRIISIINVSKIDTVWHKMNSKLLLAIL